jgi:hypothetical protein
MQDELKALGVHFETFILDSDVPGDLYQAYCGSHYYPLGGSGDLVGTFKNLKEAVDSLLRVKALNEQYLSWDNFNNEFMVESPKSIDWWHISHLDPDSLESVIIIAGNCEINRI